MTSVLLFGALPYLAIGLMLVVSIQRYRRDGFTVTSLSSEFLESKWLFWGSVPLHLGIITVFFGHLIGFLVPRSVMAWNAVPLRLLILETTGLMAGILTLVGLVVLIARRASDARLRAVTSPVDIGVYVILLFQVITGLWIALGLRWGSAWYTHVLVPYLRSLFILQPDVRVMDDMPLVVRLHVIGAFLLFATFSATRLVHMLVAPIPYLWRRVQIVVWNRKRPGLVSGARS
ncbi:MAG: respiratory nitrate reductase subunit gamma [Polyangiaceae bacterium]|nr:respiratory nitrate reductase subunit gamma [Polyangiaceae bacterium]